MQRIAGVRAVIVKITTRVAALGLADRQTDTQDRRITMLWLCRLSSRRSVKCLLRT
jgi:hypothetical protein